MKKQVIKQLVGLILCGIAAPLSATEPNQGGLGERGSAAMNAPAEKSATVMAHPFPSGYERCQVFDLSVNGKPVPVICFHNGKQVEYRYAQFSFSGTVEVKVAIKKTIKTFRIRPEAYAIPGVAQGNQLSFKLSQSRYLMIQINDLDNLLLLADPMEAEICPSTGPGVFNVGSAAFVTDRTGRTNVTSIIQRAIDAASTARGTVYVPAGVYQISSITMKSNVHLYLEGGAVLRGTGKEADYSIVNPDAAKLGIKERVTTFIQYEEGASDIKISGRGMLDANGYELFDDPQGDNIRINAIRPNKNRNVVIEGVIISRSRWWTVTPHQCDGVRIENVKVLNTEHRLNTDGFNIISCQNAVVRHCFAYANDDVMCVKPGRAGNFTGILQPPDLPVRNVVFDDVVTYNRTHACKLGYQGATHCSNVWFKNIEVLKTRNGIGIQHYQDGGVMEDIHFVNINVEELVAKSWKPYPIRIEIPVRDPSLPVVPGIREKAQVRNVEIRNVTFRSFGDGDTPDGYNGQNSIIAGQCATSWVKEVSIVDLRIAGRTILDAASGHFDINEFATNITFSATKAQIHTPSR